MKTIVTSLVHDGSLRIIDITPELKIKRTKVLEKRGREHFVQQITTFRYYGHDYIASARRGGSIQVYRYDQDKDAYQLEYVYGNNLHISGESEDQFISLIFREDCLHSCSCLGKVVIQNLGPILNERHTDDYSMLNYLSLSIAAPVTCFKLHPLHRWVSISGGKDREMEVNDFYSLTHQWKMKHPCLIDHSFLDGASMDEMKWVQDFLIVEADCSSSKNMNLVIASRFGKLMSFDTTVSMHPLNVMDIKVKKMFNLGANKVLVLDSFNTMSVVDLVDFKVVQSWNDIETGSIASIEILKEDEDSHWLVIGSNGSVRVLAIYHCPCCEYFSVTPMSKFKFKQKSIISSIAFI